MMERKELGGVAPPSAAPPTGLVAPPLSPAGSSPALAKSGYVASCHCYQITPYFHFIRFNLEIRHRASPSPGPDISADGEIMAGVDHAAETMAVFLANTCGRAAREGVSPARRRAASPPMTLQVWRPQEDRGPCSRDSTVFSAVISRQNGPCEGTEQRPLLATQDRIEGGRESVLCEDLYSLTRREAAENNSFRCESVTTSAFDTQREV